MAPKKTPSVQKAVSREEAISIEIQQAVENNELPHIYFNGFSQTLSSGDILLVLKQNDSPIAVLNTSYTMAKTLVQKLGNLIVQLENKTQNTIMTTDDIERLVGTENNE